MNKNEKTFRLVNKTSQTFSIIIANFEFATTLLFNIRMNTRLAYVMTLFIAAITSIRLRRIRIVISTVKLITKITQTISSKKISLSVVFRQRITNIITVYLRTPMTFVSKAKIKLVTVLTDGKIYITTSPVFVILYTLGHWDAFTLLPLDAMTLGDMDYTVV